MSGLLDKIINSMCKCSGKYECKNYYLLAGRILIAILFLVAGWGKLTGFAGTVGFVASGGFPMPEVFAVLAIIFELGGGLMLLLGFHSRIAAKALIVFTVIATAVYHNVFVDATQQVMLLKNLAIIGGLLYVSVFGAGAYSLQKNCGNANCPDCKEEEKKEVTV